MNKKRKYYWKHNNTFYSSINDIATRLVGTKQQVKELADEWRIFVYVLKKQNLFIFNERQLVYVLEAFHEYDYSMPDDININKYHMYLLRLFKKHIDFKKINAKIPKEYLFDRLKTKKITKKMLLKSFKKPLLKP